MGTVLLQELTKYFELFKEAFQAILNFFQSGGSADHILIGTWYQKLPVSFGALTPLSLQYILFVFIVFVLSRIFKSRLRPYVLLLADIIFLYSFSLYHLVACFIITMIGYFFSLILMKKKNRFILLLFSFVFVLILGVYKYAGLFNQSLLVPLGLSFYSFKIISYLSDICSGKTEGTKNPIYYADYVLFFAAITAGPIHRFEEFYQTLSKPQEFDYKDAKAGGFQLMLGIYEKMVFCDFIATVVERALSAELSGLNTLLGVVLYSFQIYLDFDSYSNIAIGTARLLGFDLRKNFHSPYFAKSLRDFWSRWHISLSSWFRDYIYIPLGGNRKGLFRRYLNLMIVFVISGLWHGSTLNFLLWGILNGVIQIIEDIIALPFKKIKENTFTKIITRVLGIPVNFIIVTFLWLIFRYQSMDEVISVIQQIRTLAPLDFELIGLTHNEVLWTVCIISVTVILDIMRNYLDMLKFFNKLIFPVRWAVYILLVFTFMIFAIYGGSFAASDFIYQWF